MSDGTATVVGDALCVLVAGDSDPADDAMAALAARFDGVSLLRERTLEGARQRLADREVHCVVCPFAPTEDGPTPADATLERLAARADDRPIIAVTDETAADRALEAGASDVVGRDESAAVLAARVGNAAERERYRLVAERSDRRHRSILEHAAAAVWVCDANGEIEYASPAVESRMGYTPTELERTTITRLVHPDDREAVRETIASAAAAPIGTTDRVTCRLGHADGTWHVADLVCTNRLADPALEGVVVTRTGPGAATDATAGSDDARAGLERLEDAFFTLGPRGEIRYANRAAERLLAGIADRSIDGDIRTGTVVWELLPDRFGTTLADRVREAETTESVVEFEPTDPELEADLFVAVHPGDDGISVHVRESSPGAASDAAATDRDRLALLESVVDALDEGIAVLEGSTVQLANPALLDLAETDSLVGRDLEVVFDDDLAATIRERAQSPVVRWMDPVTGEFATDATASVDVFVAPLPDPDRTLCVVRDRRESRAAALSTIRRTVATLRRAETPAAIRESVTDAVRECADADAAVWYRADDDHLRPATVTTRETTAERAPGGDGPGIEPSPINPADTPFAGLLESGEPTVYDRAEFGDALSRAGLRAERLLAVPVADRGLVLATSTEPMAFDGIETESLEILSDAAGPALAALECAESLRTCQRDRDRVRSAAERAEHVWDDARTLLDADTRETVERRLCEAVVSLEPTEPADGIELAWVGRADDARERIVPETWAGRDGEFLESMTVPLDRAADSPTGTAATTRDPAVVETLETDAAGRPPDGDGDDRRNRLLERGFRAALRVPIESDDRRYGTLTAYAGRSAAFDDATRRACDRLATIAGEAIAAIETRRALLADRVTELEVVCRDDAEPLSAIAHRLGRRVDVRAVIPRSSGGSTVFCSLPEAAVDAERDAVRETVGSLPAVDSLSIAGRGSGETVLEIGLAESAEPSVARTIADHGGVLRSLAPVDDRTRLTIDLGEPVSVRSFLRALEAIHPGTELVARRDRDRPPRATRPFETLAADLSERQRRTLEAAYYGGFFEWPRERTGEEVAESLGVSQPTFSRHLRIAQRKLFTLLFDGRGGE
ncbi:bacterio-opsin activator domain-containing protein [Natrinema versiforme]|uniref:PAS sensor protein n=1 Tax=Natrinema versiforme JCM 10478 TaxID=1227496 RepID=L9Y077_9EURY|nr:bacterio-opsin activator domain-containing protein [Natrinema versiforme]ELY67117.1 PAS sensor protein [Natrinema versiforme JCM 10478]